MCIYMGNYRKTTSISEIDSLDISLVCKSNILPEIVLTHQAMAAEKIQ